MTTDTVLSDRRAKSRFQIRRELRYKLLHQGRVVEAGTGSTVDIGSGGVAFQCGRLFSAGEQVELSISWPVLLEESCRMQLRVLGKVLRSEGDRSICSVDKYEFRTQARVVHHLPAASKGAALSAAGY